MARTSATPKRGTKKTGAGGRTTGKSPATSKARGKTGLAGSKRKKTTAVRTGKVPDNPTGASHHGKELPPQFATEEDDGEKDHKDKV